jgi:hypothetical protein
MSKICPVLAVFAVLTVLGARAAPPTTGGDPKVVIGDSAIRQAQLQRAFEAFRRKLAVLAGRLETSASERDRDRGAALRRALKLAGDRSIDIRFETLIRSLGTKGADRNIDLLAQIIRDNTELRQDLKALLRMLTEDDRDKRLAERAKETGRLLDQLKELRRIQARLQALGERGKHDSKDLAKQQE